MKQIVATDDLRDEDVMLPAHPLGEQTLAVDLARGELDQAIATAHRFPRSIDVFVKKINTMACYNEAAAENCVYSLPRGGKPIIGPSVGFANVIMQAWGNCRAASRIVYVDRKEKMVVTEGAFLDLETNSQTVVPGTRRIVDKNGRIFSDDMIMVTGMASASIVRRNAILNAVPRALWFPTFEKALGIVRGDMETFAERKAKTIKAFAQFGVKPEQLFGYLGLKGEQDLSLEHIPTLRGMYAQLRDQVITVEEMFDPRRLTGNGFDQVANPLADEQKSAGEPAAPAKRRGRPPKVRTIPPEPGIEANAAPEPAPTAEPEPANQVPPPAPLPTNAKLYMEHLREWLVATDTADAVESRWKSERDLRGHCMVIEDVFQNATAMKDARIMALGPAHLRS